MAAIQAEVALFVEFKINRENLMTEAEREKVHRLWDDLADFPFADTDKAWFHLVDHLCTWIQAHKIHLFVSVRAKREIASYQVAEHGWRHYRIQSHKRMHDGLPGQNLAEDYFFSAQNKAAIYLPNSVMSQPGKFRAYRLLRTSKKSSASIDEAVQKFNLNSELSDRIWVVFPVNDHAESCYVFDRLLPTAPFTKCEVSLVSYALRGIKQHHRQMLLSHGHISAQRPLTAMQRVILKGLLKGYAEKEIAVSLHRSPATIHRHVKNIFLNFRVHSRAELMSRWLGYMGAFDN